MTEQATQTNEQEGQLLDGQGNAISVEDAIKAKEGQEKVPEKESERPQWLPEKFKAPEDLVKSYSELEKTLKERGKVAPEQYVIDDAEELKGAIDPESEEFKGFAKLAKDANMNNAQFNSVLKYAKEIGFLDSGPVYEEEMKALGSEGKEIIDRLDRFASNRLTESERTILENLVITSDSAKLLDKIVRMSDRSLPVKPGEDQTSTKRELETQLQGILQNPNIRTDFTLKQQAEELAKRIASM
jgi:hypothetical protein